MAFVEYRKAIDFLNRTPFAVACLLLAYYKIGEKDEVGKIFDACMKRSESEYVPATLFYVIYKLLGEEDLAWDSLKRACAEHDTFLTWFKDSPAWFPADSRYLSLLREAGLK